jgi:hypothetical protein
LMGSPVPLSPETHMSQNGAHIVNQAFVSDTAVKGL